MIKAATIDGQLQVLAAAPGANMHTLQVEPDSPGAPWPQSDGRMARVGDSDIDRQLVERVQGGDKAAFDLLVRKYQHKLLSVIGRYVSNWSDAQDVAQDTFVRAYRAIGSFRGDSAFYTWLYKIATNTSKNWLVSQGRRPPSEDIDVDDAVLFDGDSRLKDRDTPERELMRQQVEQIVYRTVEALPEELRTAITLREVDGLSYEEIAQTMKCPIGTVRSRIFRAREAVDQQLRGLLDQDL
jgi:RNA polymerase sigma-70 factor, ECF subfamily